jgi:hypothetical protein
VQFRLGPRRIALWNVTVRNTNLRVAFRDVLYRTSYLDPRGEVIEQRSNYIKDVYQPGTVTRLELNDGIFEKEFASTRIEMLDAEALLPIK